MTLADGWNVQAGWRFYPVPEERFVLERDQRLVVRISAPADELSLNGTLVFKVAGKKGPRLGWPARPGLR